MSLNADDFAFIQKFLHEQSGVLLEDGKEYLVDARLTSVAHRAGFTSLADFIAHLRLHRISAAHRMLVVEALTTHETLFFRDIHPFHALKMSILPELIAKRAAERHLNLWCAAASSGQEPYSVAMLLDEHFPDLLQWSVQCIASDVSDTLLERAQGGCYSQLEVNRGLPAPLLNKYFQRHGARWQLSETIRRRVAFRHLNLIHAWPSLPPMDLILMRNVLIYFDVATRQTILEKVRRLLKPDGYLLLGSTETILPLDTAFKRVRIEKTVCYQVQV